MTRTSRSLRSRLLAPVTLALGTSLATVALTSCSSLGYTAVEDLTAGGGDTSRSVLSPRLHLLTVEQVIDLGGGTAPGMAAEQATATAAGRIRGLEAMGDGRLLAQLAPADGAGTDDTDTDTDSGARIIIIDPAAEQVTERIRPVTRVSLPEGAGGTGGADREPVQSRLGWGLTQLIGTMGENDKVRTPDVWAAAGATYMTGLNLTGQAQDHRGSHGDQNTIQAAPLSGLEVTVGMCALETPQPVALKGGETLSTINTRHVVTSSGSSALMMRDPVTMTPDSHVTAHASEDGEKVTSRDLAGLARGLGQPVHAAATTDAEAGTDEIAFPLTLPVTSTMVTGLGELDCLDSTTATAWAKLDSPVGTGSPSVLAVVNNEMSDTFVSQMVADGQAGNPDLPVAALPEETAAVLVDPDSGLVADLFYVMGTSTETAVPQAALSTIAVDTTDPNKLWATFEGVPGLYRLALTK